MKFDDILLYFIVICVILKNLSKRLGQNLCCTHLNTYLWNLTYPGYYQMYLDSLYPSLILLLPIIIVPN